MWMGVHILNIIFDLVRGEIVRNIQTLLDLVLPHSESICQRN